MGCDEGLGSGDVGFTEVERWLESEREREREIERERERERKGERENLKSQILLVYHPTTLNLLGWRVHFDIILLRAATTNSISTLHAHTGNEVITIATVVRRKRYTQVYTPRVYMTVRICSIMSKVCEINVQASWNFIPYRTTHFTLYTHLHIYKHCGLVLLLLKYL